MTDGCPCGTPRTRGKICFVGAGPGDPDLITVKGRKLLEQAGAILYAGSLVDRAATRYAPPDCEIRDSKDMTLEEIVDWLREKAARHALVVRLQTGDPSLYGALIEMTRPLEREGFDWEVVPGISSAMASMAVARETMTLPEVTQTVILTRAAGRTSMPEGEDLESLAAHHCTLCVYLSATLIHEVQRALRAAGWREDAPLLVVQKASWQGEEKIVRGTLADIREKCQAEKIGSQAMIVASPALGSSAWETLVRSKLYDPAFTHRFRRGLRRQHESS
ncbi:MAG: precorrin-4 C(11)-methyltransferase [Candidatus Accumulibacter sp.]|jgi:precorrin-4/cobalt-precorrin-4 C11-methyltransferase|nr:precorrin-4 C(11)-methyltransferase [Accumulibacter sp.]